MPFSVLFEGIVFVRVRGEEFLVCSAADSSEFVQSPITLLKGVRQGLGIRVRINTRINLK